MTVAATLEEAAGLAYTNVSLKQAAQTLQPSINAFWTTLNAPGLFQDQKPNDHPVANWLAIIADLAVNMATPDATINEVNAAAQYVYRICLVTAALYASALITNAQQLAVLASYNTNLG